MQIMITHGSMARTRVLHFNRLQLIALALGLVIGLLALSGTIYHVIFLKAAREGWPVVSQIVRLVVRFTRRTPPLPADLPGWQVLAAKASHVLLYALMLILPLLGWSMISAAGDPVMLSESLRLPSILPADAQTFALLRKAHGYLAYLLFLTVLVHLAAALFHGWVRRDEVLDSMLRGKS